MIKSFYLRHIGNRFFFKLLLFYSIIIIATISLLVFVIAYNITTILREQALNYNKQVLQTVSNYFYNQNKNFKKIMNSMYIDGWGKDRQVIYAIQELFKNSKASLGNAQLDEEHISSVRILNDYLSDVVLPSDIDIIDIVVVNPACDFDISASKYISFPKLLDYKETIYKSISVHGKENINRKKSYILSPFKVTDYSNSVNIYGIYDYLRGIDDSSSFIGYMVATYNLDSIKNSYSQFSKYLIGNIMIVSNDGQVIFDSSGKYYSQPFTYFKKINTSTSNSIPDKDYIINSVKNKEFGFTVVGMISKSELYKNVNSLNEFIIVTAIISIMLILALTFLSTNRFSKRVKNIISTLREVQKGNLSARATLKGNNDEIEQISYNLNLMSERLDEYIKKEYVSELHRKDAELKQKSAELYALQSQINPHFLYNTLEAIRMRALSTGDSSTGDMIKILARLFRSSIKDEMVVSIEEEINYSKLYLELYKIRFGDNLKVIYDIDPCISKYAMIKHLLQPIIENSIVHGINLNKENNVITIKARIIGNAIEISVIDNGQGIDEKTLETIIETLKTPRIHYKENIGIFNVDSRIKLIYGNDYGIQISSRPGAGTEVILRIIALSKEELLKNVQSINS